MRTAVVPLDVVFDLRHAVLRSGLPADAARYPEDDLPGTFHLAVYDGEGDEGGEGGDGAPGAVVGCVTFFPEPWPGAPGVPAHRFRGMGTAPGVRGKGHGAALLKAGVAEAAAAGAEVMWCNGRTSARRFYERAGFSAVGEEFPLEPSGPHFVFVLRTPGPRAPDGRSPAVRARP